MSGLMVTSRCGPMPCLNNAIEEMQRLVESTNLSDNVKKKVCDDLQCIKNKLKVLAQIIYDLLLFEVKVGCCKIQGGDRFCSTARQVRK